MCVVVCILTGCSGKSGKDEDSVAVISDTAVTCTEAEPQTESPAYDDYQFPEMQKSAIKTMKKAVEAYEKAHRSALKRFNEHNEQTSKHFATGEVEEYDSNKEQMEYFWEPLDRDCKKIGISSVINSLDEILGVRKHSQYYASSQELLNLRDSIKEFLSQYDFRDSYHGSEYSLANYDFINDETTINLKNENNMQRMIQEYEDKYLIK